MSVGFGQGDYFPRKIKSFTEIFHEIYEVYERYLKYVLLINNKIVTFFALSACLSEGCIL